MGEEVMYIYLDMDGVISDFTTAALIANGVDPSAHIAKEYKIEKDLGISARKFWENIDNVGEVFWSDMGLFSWTIDLIGSLDNFIILSSPSMNPQCVSGKLKWIYKVLGSSFRNYMFVPSNLKCKVANQDSILIDDSEKNCEDFMTAGGYSVLFPQPYNKNRDKQGDVVSYIHKKIEEIKEYRYESEEYSQSYS